MNWNDFYAALKAKDFHPVYLFGGAEDFIKRGALDALRASLLPEGLEELNEIFLEDASAQQIIESAETLPVMCERRLVVVRDWPPLMSGKSKNEEAEVERISAWLLGAPDTCCVVFYMRGDADGKKKLTALLKKSAANVQFNFLGDAELTKWANQRLKPLGKRMSGAAASHLAFTAGRGLMRISGELEKLAAYVGEREEILPGDISKIVAPSLEFSVFEMLDRLLSGNLAGATDLLNVTIEAGQSRIGILSMLTRQFRSLLHMKLAEESGGSARDIEELLKLNHYAAGKMARQSKRYTQRELTDLYRQLIDADYGIKSGQLREQLALDMLFLRICRV